MGWGNFNLDIGDYKIKTKGNKKEKVVKNHQHITSKLEYTTSNSTLQQWVGNRCRLGDL